MEIKVQGDSAKSFPCEALLFPLFLEPRNTDLDAWLEESFPGLLADLEESVEWKNLQEEVVCLYRPSEVAAKRVVLVGVLADKGLDKVRQAVRRWLRTLRGARAARIAAVLPDAKIGQRYAEMVTQGIVLGQHNESPYKSDHLEPPIVDELVFLSQAPVWDGLLKHLRTSETLSGGVNLARHVTNEPGNRMSPTDFVDIAQKVAEKSGLSIEVLDQAQMEKEGMEAILAVGQGSDSPPRLLILKHWADTASSGKVFCFVGKGVTFDSGGLSLKSAASMEEMKTDKAGAAAVLGAMQVLGELRVRANVVAVIPLVENLPGGRAQRPGDVVQTMSGKTVEVLNTDAEGRLILADALTYARTKFSPDWIVDIATLTGACMIALGTVRAGVFSNDRTLRGQLEAAAEKVGERFWPLPLDDDYKEGLKSKIADLKNVGGRWGGAVTAAKFLEEFVGDTPWCHVDMAGLDMFSAEKDGKGPQGFGVLTLARMVMDESGFK